MENASDGCVKTADQNSKTISTAAADDCQPNSASPYVNKPIFRRKLIEKYSTARYNINTKRISTRRILVKVSPPYEFSNNVAPIENAKKSSLVDSSNGDQPSTTSTSCTSTKTKVATENCKTPTRGKRSSRRCLPIPSESNVNQDYSSNTKKRKLASAVPSSSAGTSRAWKIAPKSIFNHLWDMYRSPVQGEPEPVPEPEPDEEPKKETKTKRKMVYSRTKKRTRKKAASWQKTTASSAHFDPYVECLKEVNIPTESAATESTGQRLGIVMHLGVDRPLFPLVYRNLRVLNDSNDEKVTDFWAEFSLSTLITKREEKKCKPVLVPIKDAELATLASECVEATVVRSEQSDVSNATSISEYDSPPVLVKQDEIPVAEPEPPPPPPPPKPKRRSRPVEKPSKSYKLRAKKSRETVEQSENQPEPASGNIEKVEIKLDEKVVEEKVIDEKASTDMSEKSVEKTEPKSKTKTKTKDTDEKPKPEDAERRLQPVENKRRPKPTLKAEENMLENIINRSRRARAGPKSKSRRSALAIQPKVEEKSVANRPAVVKPKVEEKAVPSRVPVPVPVPVTEPKVEEKFVLKKFGYKECFVAIPKLSDTLIKYLSAGNYSNQSAELSDPTERELIEETDDFGLIQCTRTDGVVIDYVKRNRSLVYFYKLKKMLDFQKTNNKYFVCCDYILIDEAKNDEPVDITSLDDVEDGAGSAVSHDDKTVATSAVRSSRNPNDLFKTSKLSELKNKSNNICWVKNHDLRLAVDVKWLIISLDKLVASLSHVSGCVLRYRLLFEIIYRAELSKKVICCQITELPEGSDEKLAFGVYAFPGLCDKVLVGPYSYHEQHQLSVFLRTSEGYSVRSQIKTLEEKENFPQLDESRPVKHINAKWWSGSNNNDSTEQYLNFFFNPTVVKCVPQTDRINLNKIIEDHPCFNYHSYEITGRESNLVLFHDRTNSIEKTAVDVIIETPQTLDTDTNIDVGDTSKDPLVTVAKQSRNLRKKPRMDYSQLVTDDMAIPIRSRNCDLRIVDVKSLRKRGSRTFSTESKATAKRSRYQEAPQLHIMNERLRRLEFRNRRNNLASLLETRPSGSNNNAQSLVSILHQASEIIAFLNADNEKLDEEGKRLRAEQSVMMRKLLAQLRSFDINSTAYKDGMTFLAEWKKIKSAHRNRLIEILGQNFEKYKSTKATAELCGTAAASSALLRRSSTIRTVQRFESNIRKTTLENAKNASAERATPQSKDEETAQRLNLRKMRRQKLREVYRQRNNNVPREQTIDAVECEISEEVICGDGTSSDPRHRFHVEDKVGEIPIVASNVPVSDDPYAVDPLADDEDEDDGDGATSSGRHSSAPAKEPPHPLYYEHSYCCVNQGASIDLTNEPDQPIPVIPIRGRPIRTFEEQQKSAFLNRHRLNIAKKLAASSQQQLKHRPILPVSSNSAMLRNASLSQQRRRIPILATTPILRNSVTRPRQRTTPITTASGSIVYDSAAASSSSSSSSQSSQSQSQQRKNLSRGSLPLPGRSSFSPSTTFQITVKKTADNNLCLDIIDNGRVFARLNIAKVNDGNTSNNSNDAASSSRESSVSGITTYSKIMSIIQRFLHQMEKTSPVFTCGETNDDERSKQAKRRHVVNSLRSFISKFEHRRKNVEDGGYSSSSRASNSDGSSPPYVADNIELDDGYSSKGSEASCDRDRDRDPDQEPEDRVENEKSQIVTVTRDRLVSDDLSIENIVVDDSSDDEQDEEIVPEDQLIAEEEEEEEIVGQEELIDEEEEEEEIVGQGNTLEEMNDVVDAAMRFDQSDRFSDSSPSTDEDTADSQIDTFAAMKPSSKMRFTNPFVIRSKDKFVPNIMKTPTKQTEASSIVDHLSRVQIKSSVGSLVKLSSASASLQLASNLVYPNEAPCSSDNKNDDSSSNSGNDSIIKRLWYSPVTKVDNSDMKILRRESNLSDASRSSAKHVEKLSNTDDESSSSENGDTTEAQVKEENQRNDTSDDHAGPENSSGTRILIKSFANHNKFQKAFLSNVDKLLNPEL